MRIGLAAMVVAFLVATPAHAQAPGKEIGPQSCSWSSGVIPDSPPSPARIIVAPSVAAASLIHRAEPDYPADARSEGTVVLCALITKDGTIEGLQYVSGPAQLMRAAMKAVAQWRYKSTLLNGEPVEVETRIFVDVKRPGSGSGPSAAKATK